MFFFFTCISIITAHVLLYTFSSSLYLYFTKERFIKMIYAIENYDLIAVFIGITNETFFYKLQVNHLSSELPLIGWIKWKAHVWCTFESHWRNTFNLCIQKSFRYFKLLTNNLLFHSCAEYDFDYIIIIIILNFNTIKIIRKLIKVIYEK